MNLSGSEVAEVFVVMFFVGTFLIHAVYYAIALLFLYIFFVLCYLY